MKTLNLPSPLLLPFRVLPAAVHTEVLARIFNHFLQGQTVAGRLQALDGKSVCIEIVDLDLALKFRIRGKTIQPSQQSQWDVRIRGKLADFLRLATRNEDPDTLFFNRHLCLEGDTETGLHVKNLLDAMEFDWQAHLRTHLGQPAADVVYAITSRLPLRYLPNPFLR